MIRGDNDKGSVQLDRGWRGREEEREGGVQVGGGGARAKSTLT